MQTLGEKLKFSIDAAAQAKAQALADEQAKANFKREKMRAAVKDYFLKAKNHFIEGITAGRFGEALLFEIGRTRTQLLFPEAADVLRHAGVGFPHREQNKAECVDIVAPMWNKLQAWATEQGLRVTWCYQHDGMGTHSWCALMVEPRLPDDSE